MGLQDDVCAVTDVFALETLCFIIEQLLLIALMFMFNVLQVHLYTRKEERKERKERVCIYIIFFFFPQ